MFFTLKIRSACPVRTLLAPDRKLGSLVKWTSVVRSLIATPTVPLALSSERLLKITLTRLVKPIKTVRPPRSKIPSIRQKLVVAIAAPLTPVGPKSS